MLWGLKNGESWELIAQFLWTLLLFRCGHGSRTNMYWPITVQHGRVCSALVWLFCLGVFVQRRHVCSARVCLFITGVFVLHWVCLFCTGCVCSANRKPMHLLWCYCGRLNCVFFVYRPGAGEVHDWIPRWAVLHRRPIPDPPRVPRRERSSDQARFELEARSVRRVSYRNCLVKLFNRLALHHLISRLACIQIKILCNCVD